MFEGQPRTGDLLIGRRLLTREQLKLALDAQVVHGGRIGTNLVELGAVTIDQLALVLGEQHGVPAASQHAFASVTSASLGAMPRAMCEAYGACPLLLEGPTLHLAMLDPYRLEVIHHIGKTLGLTIYAYAAPQLRLLYYLELHYQIPRPRRYLREPDLEPLALGERRHYLEATPVDENAVVTVKEGLVPRPRQPSGSVQLAERGGTTLRVGGESLDFEIDVSLLHGEEEAPPVGLAPKEQVLEGLDTAADRTAVISLLVRPVLPETALAALFLVRGDFAVALGAWGTELEAQRVRSLAVPLSVPSLLRQAFRSGLTAQGRVQGDASQQLIANYLQGPSPTHACVIPVRVDGITANLLCVQSSGPLGADAVAQLEEIGRRGGAAYDRLMRRELQPAEGSPEGWAPGEVIWAGAGTNSWTGSGSARPLQVQQQQSQREFGRYELLCRIASGGMANLYLARLAGPERFQKLVAIKRIHDHLSHDTEFIRRFSDEARLAARISHPNVVQVIELGAVGSSHFIAMEYVDGEDLSALLARTELPPRIAARIVANAAAALHAAHELRDERGELLHVVHRDVSPQNLLISYAGEVKVVDFGVAQARGNLAHSIVGTILGKLGYMAPEQARGEPLDRRVDVYALGIVLYEASTRRRLFAGDSEAATLTMVLDAEIERPSRIVPKYPRKLERIVMRALEREPAQRFQTAEEVQVALEEFISSSGPPVLSSAIAQLMQGVFVDRIAQKNELLRRVG